MNQQGASVGWNHIFSPRLVNEFRIGWGRDWSSGVQDPFGANKLSDYISGVADNPLYSGGIPRISISSRGGTQSNTTSSLGGVDNWGSPDFLPKFQYTNQYQWIDTLNLTMGKHQLKMGVDARVPMRNIFLDVPQMRGQLTFDGQRTGVGLADFLLGYPQAQNLSNPAVSDARLWMLSEFVQDDWKFTPKLTLNLGLRYDYATWPYSGADRMTNLLDPNPNAVNATGVLFCAGQVVYPCIAASPVGRTLVKPDKNNFAPRVGLAYRVLPNTVVRAGYGRFYMLFERAGSEDQMFLDPPWLINKSVSASSASTTANNMRLATGFNVSLDPNNVDLTQVRLRAVNPNNVQPEVDQWNLGVERELPGQLVTTVEYVGTKGTHLSILRNLNQIYFDSLGRACTTVTGTPTCPGITAPFIPYANLGAIEFRDNVGNSTYHGLELSAIKRFSHGLSFTAAYTWSHSIDQVQEHLISGAGSGSFLQNEHDLRQQRGASDFDVRHRFVLGYVYDLPFGPTKSMLTSGPLSQIARGWRVSGGTILHTGRPFTIIAGNNNSFVQTRGGSSLGQVALADCLRGAVPGQFVEDGGGGGPLWFDKTAFATPSAPDPADPTKTVARLGTCPRNNMRGPSYANVDLALARTFSYFGEGRSLEFRCETFNLLNIAQFALPTNNVNSGNFGRITSLAGDPRVMQFALRFAF
jgi:outer membrane receptor protein involved in Fe transport